MPVNEDGTFTFIIGTTFHYGLNRKGPAPTYTPIDCSGSSFVFGIRPEGRATPALELATTDSGPSAHGSSLVWVSQSGGTSNLVVTRDEIAALTFTDGHWWLNQITGTVVDEIFAGKLRIRNPS